ncbi:MAG: 50S ribosomal protein L33 [Candidatus Marinimicrobia bacterium]|nr:50S ribosomal protein L33 [Candidatus Neomarinimicrobiota bacterium]
MGNSKRSLAILECVICKRSRYTTTKSRRSHPERIEHSKYCRWCRTHTVHRETK